MNTTKQIQALMQSMKAEHVDAVIVPTNDPHMSEYPPEHFKTRRFLSGFTGSAGTAVFCSDTWGLWTDGRYYIQAQHEIEPNGGILFRAADAACPSIGEYLASHLPEGSTVSINGELCSCAFFRELHRVLNPKKIHIRCDLTLAENVWTKRPTLTPQPIWSTSCAAGKSVAEKVSEVRGHLLPSSHALLTARLDSNAWLFNIRAEDVPYVPAPVSYSLVLPDRAILFTDVFRIPEEVGTALSDQGVTVLPYEKIRDVLAQLKDLTIQLEPAEINKMLWDTISANHSLSIAEGDNPVPFLKAVKTSAEIRHTQEAYWKDCAALCEFYAKLEALLDAKETVTEYEASQLLEQQRRKSPDYLGSSFAPIVGYKENAAMMHYGPTAESSKMIQKEGFLLIDTGGHYRYGTTDITRTYSFGSLTQEDREDYTTVIKGFIGLHTAVFKDGTPGRELDNLCRVHLWRRLLDYRCGTGHGVGFLLNIHEGPHGFGPGARDIPLHEGMYITVEPGIYRENVRGIRCENAVYVVPYGESEYGNFLCLNTFTFLPIDPAPLLLEHMDACEIRWLNHYNQQVRDAMLPRVSPEAAEWVRKRTEPIS